MASAAAASEDAETLSIEVGEVTDEMKGDSDMKSDDETSSTDDSEDMDEEEAEVTVDPAFRQRVADALRVSGAADEGDADGDDTDEESEEWTDEQMLEVDEQLADVFRQQAMASKRSDLKRGFS